jgi:hypothetical protein
MVYKYLIANNLSNIHQQIAARIKSMYYL